MKNWWLIGWLVFLSACSSNGVRCGKHLHPINVVAPPAAASGTSTDHP